MIMASSSSSTIFLLFLFILFTASSSIFNTPDTLCNSTPYPKFCRSSLPYNKPGTLPDFARISLQNSLGISRNFLTLIEHFLSLPSTSFRSTILALEDCRLLGDLNIDSLSYTVENAEISDTLLGELADDLHTLLSATLTNLETCLDGLRFTGSASGLILKQLLGPITNGKMQFSVSLALFRQGFLSEKAFKGRFLMSERKQISPDVASGKGLALNGRKLLQDFSIEGVVVRERVVVNPDGSGNFTTISDAVNAAPNNTKSSGGEGYYVIYVVAGVYNEYVSIPKTKRYLMMIGAGINQTVITGDRSFVDGWTTFNTATFAVVGQGFVAMNITFRNMAGAAKHQAVAVRNGADLSTFYNCSFEGYQDTLYTHSLRQFYKNCDIYGTIDYIFGNAAVVFQDCRIFSRLPMSNQFNTITAQGRTDPNQNTGTSIQNCQILADETLSSSNGTTRTYLGRPWKQYSRTVFMQSSMDSLIDPAGWAPWSGDFALSTLYYAEFDNSGSGSNTTNRVTWPGYHVINESDATDFTVSEFIQGDYWLPATGVSYVGGLY